MTTRTQIQSLGWPKDRLPAALGALLKESGMAVDLGREAFSGSVTEQMDTAELVEWQAKVFACVADPVELGLGQVEEHLPGLCPLLLELEGGTYLSVLAMGKGRATLLTSERKRVSVSTEALYRTLRAPFETEATGGFSDLIQAAGLERDDALLDGLLKQDVSGKGCRLGWSFRRQTTAGLTGMLRESGACRNGLLLAGAHVLQYLLWLASWSILGRLSLRGQMDRAWLVAWALLLFSLIPLRVFTTYAQGVLAIAAGAALKRHLLLGTMRMDPQQSRMKGIGSIISQVFEAEAVENLALSGGISGVLAGAELLIAGFILGPLSLLLLGFVLFGGAIVYAFKRRYERCTAARMQMSEQLIEAMVGHRTRAAQQPAEQWHRTEDGRLETYLAESRKVDRTGAWLVSALPRLWLLAGLTMLAPAALSGLEEQSTIALRLGGILLAFSALQRLSSAAMDIAGTWVAAQRIANLFKAAGRREVVGSLPPESLRPDGRSKVMEVEKAEFRYEAGAKLALQPSSLTVRHGERLLLEGPSGGGKSTLSALMAGTRTPVAGLLLAGGLDRHTLGEQGWRKRVATAPQFHDNHILTETLAFNLLMGRQWPPRQHDLEEAEALCRELSLGELLDRMPAGLMQMVGEGGWQLSHGERSRVFLARALLQKSALTILDESFGALDPDTARIALTCTLDHTDALLVIAHP